jgi:hypothetical protein
MLSVDGFFGRGFDSRRLHQFFSNILYFLYLFTERLHDARVRLLA